MNLYLLGSKPFKALDGKIYNVFRVEEFDKTWLGPYGVERFYEIYPPSYVILRDWGVSQHDPEEHNFEIIFGGEAPVRNVKKKPYRSRKTGNLNPVIDPIPTGVNYSSLKQKYFVYDSKISLNVKKNKLIPIDIMKWWSSSDSEKKVIAIKIMSSIF